MKWYCVITLCVFCAAPATFISSESEALQQAFVLVDLLKSEYARMNKQNSFLRTGVAVSTPEQPTCPTTKHPANNDHSFPLDGGSLAVPSRRLLLNNLTPGSANNAWKRLRLSRRLVNNTGDLRAGACLAQQISIATQRGDAANVKLTQRQGPKLLKSRRLEYDDMFGPHPGEKPKEPTSQAQATSIGRPTSNLATSIPPLPLAESTILTASEVTHLSTRSSIDYEQTIKAKIEGHKAVKLKLTNQKKPTSRDPVVEQVASEIMNEMKDKTNSKFKVEIAPLFTAKTEPYTRFENVKGTYRIHQATSKRYPIPLPENNAFCFYHPDSPLCRTFI